jgi:hypothetical protein
VQTGRLGGRVFGSSGSVKDEWWWALFEHDNANPASIKCEKFLNQLRNYNILKRDLVAICIKRILRWLADINVIY